MKKYSEEGDSPYYCCEICWVPGSVGAKCDEHFTHVYCSWRFFMKNYTIENPLDGRCYLCFVGEL